MLAIGCQCSLPSILHAEDITIVSYNVHNLFDADESGKEYPEFKPSKGKWSKELYAKRLVNTADAVSSFELPTAENRARAFVPDVLCVQEI